MDDWEQWRRDFLRQARLLCDVALLAVLLLSAFDIHNHLYVALTFEIVPVGALVMGRCAVSDAGQAWIRRWMDGHAEQPSFVCPVCGMRSYNPNDIAAGYCGRCHDWTGVQ